MIQPAENTNTRFMVESQSQSEFTMKSLRNSSRFDHELAVASLVTLVTDLHSTWEQYWLKFGSNESNLIQVNQRTTFTIAQ